MTTYYFAWVDEADSDFDIAYLREDEQVFAFEVSQAEGEFSALTVDIRNPEAGLLNPSRKQWAWLSADFGDTAGGQPLFFGRLVGMPEEIIGRAVRLTFSARPSDFADRKASAAAALKVAPYWDPVWVTPELADDPDAVLESRSALWHIDRVTHAVTASDILEAEDGLIDLGDDVLRDSIELSFGSPPATKITCEATIGWDQAVSGSFDLKAALLAAFAAAGTSTGGVISSFTGQGLMEDWPAPGANIGGGWSFGQSAITRLDGSVLPDDFQTQIFTGNGSWGQKANWPCWKMLPTLIVRYDVSRTRREVVRFTLTSDAQAFIIDPDDSEPLAVTLSSDLVGEPVDPGEALPIGSRRRRAYFPTTRGRQSLDYLVAVCRARLRGRARSVEIKGETRLSNGAGFSCRKAIRIEDQRLPGGSATGKIISYSLKMDGDSGEALASFVIGCSVGKGNPVSDATGTPTYVEDGYVETGWQRYEGASSSVVSGEVTVSDYSNIPPNDDGLDFDHLTQAQVLDSITVFNGETEQRALINAFHSSYSEVAAALDQAYTEVDLKLKPISKGPFETVYDITVSDLALPKTIDLEAA
ncbi:UNVERIFIED_ORG: phage tail protein X [Rhizobium esperanzae]